MRVKCLTIIFIAPTTKPKSTLVAVMVCYLDAKSIRAFVVSGVDKRPLNHESRTLFGCHGELKSLDDDV